MASVNENLLQVTPDQIKKVLETLNTTESKLNEMCEDLIHWYSLQPHLPQPPPESKIIKTLLIATKISPENVKLKLDARCVLRAVKPEFFRFSDIYGPALDKLANNIHYFPLPKVTDKLFRVNFMKIVGNPEDFDLETHLKRCFMIGEYRLKKDVCLCEVFIFDLSNMKWGHLTRINPITIRNAEITNKKAYGQRIAGINILYPPSFIDKVLSLLKKSLQPKLATRIKCFSSLDELYEEIPKSILPKDYGGDEKSSEELNAEWNKEIAREEWKKLFTDEEKLVSDESKRVNSITDEELLGIQGSFRKLDFD